MNSWVIALLATLAGAVVGGGLGVLVAHRMRRGDIEWKKTFRLIGGLLGVVIAFALTDQLGGFRLNRYNVESGLDQVELFRVLKQDYPDEYAAVVARTKRILADGGTPADAGRMSRPQVQALLKRQIDKASDANLAALLAVGVLEMQQAAAASPTACVDFIDGAPFSPTKIFSKETLQRELALDADVLRQAAKAPVTGRPMLTPEALKPVYAAALASLDAVDEKLARTAGQRGRAEGTLEQQAYCRFGVALFEELERGSPARQAQLFLTLMAAK